MGDDSASAHFIQASDVVACDIEGGKALLDMKTSNYYKLNETAAQIWNWIGSGADLDALVARMLEEFDVAPDACQSDLSATLASFVEAGLIERTN